MESKSEQSTVDLQQLSDEDLARSTLQSWVDRRQYPTPHKFLEVSGPLSAQEKNTYLDSLVSESLFPGSIADTMLKKSDGSTSENGSPTTRGGASQNEVDSNTKTATQVATCGEGTERRAQSVDCPQPSDIQSS